MINKNKTYLYVVFALILSISLVLGGCQPARRPVDPAPAPTPDRVPGEPDRVPGGPDLRTPDDDTRRPGNYMTRPEDMTNPRTPEGDMGYGDNDLAARADRIADNVADMSEIRRATVVISERTAVVGVNINNQAEGRLTNEIKRKVEDEVRRTDRNIENVTVTADADTFTRIENMGREIRRGRPISGFAKEIEEIIRRIAPTT